MLDLSNTLKERGYDCVFLGGTKALYRSYVEKEKFDDTIFINYNYGLPTQFKRAQSPVLLELMNVKYSGSNPFTSLLVNDKEFTKKYFIQKILIRQTVYWFPL